MIRIHEIIAGKCRHCGTLEAYAAELTCVGRADPLTPRVRPPSAVDDVDAIHARILELRAADDAARAGEPEPEAAE